MSEASAERELAAEIPSERSESKDPYSLVKLRRFASVSEASAERELAAEILSERSESKDPYSLVK